MLETGLILVGFAFILMAMMGILGQSALPILIIICIACAIIVTLYNLEKECKIEKSTRNIWINITMVVGILLAFVYFGNSSKYGCSRVYTKAKLNIMNFILERKFGMCEDPNEFSIREGSQLKKGCHCNSDQDCLPGEPICYQSECMKASDKKQREP
jgi:hypothetical protein